jgi:hypothetical protein
VAFSTMSFGESGATLDEFVNHLLADAGKGGGTARRHDEVYQRRTIWRGARIGRAARLAERRETLRGGFRLSGSMAVQPLTNH